MQVGIIICAYNRPFMLARLLKSIAEQDDRHWRVYIADDNSADKHVGEIGIDFARAHNGVYAKSNVTDEDRLKACRYSVAINSMLPYVDSDIVLYMADDHEIASPSLVRRVLDFYEANPSVNCGYVGLGYRLADFRTGEIIGNHQSGQLTEAESLRQSHPEFKERGEIYRRFPLEIGYGGILHHAFAILDSAQFSNRRDCAVLWDESPEEWMGADAIAMEQMCVGHGGVFPIADPVNNILMYSNLNESSLTVQGSPAKSIEVLNG